MDLMVQKYRFGNERYIKQINDICKWQKITAEFGGKRSCLKESGVATQGRKEVEVGTQTMLLSIMYLLSYLSKGLFKVRDK